MLFVGYKGIINIDEKEVNKNGVSGFRNRRSEVRILSGVPYKNMHLASIKLGAFLLDFLDF